MDTKFYQIFNADEDVDLTIFYFYKRWNLTHTEFIVEYIYNDDADEIALTYEEARAIVITNEWRNDEIDTDAN